MLSLFSFSRIKPGNSPRILRGKPWGSRYWLLASFNAPGASGSSHAESNLNTCETSTAFWLNLAGSVSGAIGGAITGPVMFVALAVFYYDLRIRKEGLDVQLMMTRLDPVAPAGAPPASLPSIS